MVQTVIDYIVHELRMAHKIELCTWRTTLIPQSWYNLSWQLALVREAHIPDEIVFYLYFLLTYVIMFGSSFS